MPADLQSVPRTHWPEYLIEAFALGIFMLSAAFFTTLFESQGSPLRAALPDAAMRRALIGLAMGLTAMALIYSPWGRRSGAHMNPAVTLAFLRLGKTSGFDALCYIAAQFAGGLLGVLVSARLLGPAFTDAPVSWVATEPGAQGPWVAFAAEFTISAILMWVVLRSSANERLASWTGVFAGLLVMSWIALEAPLSGMSMNPARSFASAAPAGRWGSLWLYLLAPVLGMLTAAEAHRRRSGGASGGCAKLCHDSAQRCIHCGYQPQPVASGPLAGKIAR